jgi:hypothetical protein
VRYGSDGKVDPGQCEPHGMEAHYFVESRLLQRDVEVVLESVNNKNLVTKIFIKIFLKNAESRHIFIYVSSKLAGVFWAMFFANLYEFSLKWKDKKSDGGVARFSLTPYTKWV